MYPYARTVHIYSAVLRSRPADRMYSDALHSRLADRMCSAACHSRLAGYNDLTDSRTSQDVLGLLKVTCERFHQTMVMITHNEEIAQLANRIIRIEDGKLVKGSGLHDFCE